MKKRSLNKLRIRKVNISNLNIYTGGLANETGFPEACLQGSTICSSVECAMKDKGKD